MKHINMSVTAAFNTRPFSSIVMRLGTTARSEAYLPVKGVIPNCYYVLTSDITGEVLYSGVDLAQACAVGRRSHEQGLPYTLAENPTLPDGKFQLIKTRKGENTVVRGRDTSNRCLLTFDTAIHVLGHVERLEVGTTAKILAECRVSERDYSAIGAVLLFEEGQSFAIESLVNTTLTTRTYTWTGTELVSKTYTPKKWRNYLKRSTIR